MIFYLDLLNINFMVSTYTSIFLYKIKATYIHQSYQRIFCILYTKKITIVFEVFIFSGFWIEKKNYASLI